MPDVEQIATIIDYAAFASSPAGAAMASRRSRACDKAREILQLMEGKMADEATDVANEDGDGWRIEVAGGEAVLRWSSGPIWGSLKLGPAEEVATRLADWLGEMDFGEDLPDLAEPQ